jgi:hypothetical protein
MAHNFSVLVFTFQKRWLSLRHLKVFDNLYFNVLTDVYFTECSFQKIWIFNPDAPCMVYLTTKLGDFVRANVGWNCGGHDHQSLDCPKPKTCCWCFREGGHGWSYQAGPVAQEATRKARWCNSRTQRNTSLIHGSWCPVSTGAGHVRTWKTKVNTSRATPAWKASKWIKTTRSRLWVKARKRCFTCGKMAVWTATSARINYRSPSCCSQCHATGGMEHGPRTPSAPPPPLDGPTAGGACSA